MSAREVLRHATFPESGRRMTNTQTNNNVILGLRTNSN